MKKNDQLLRHERLYEYVALGFAWLTGLVVWLGASHLILGLACVLGYGCLYFLSLSLKVHVTRVTHVHLVSPPDVPPRREDC